jgi:putative transposase
VRTYQRWAAGAADRGDGRPAADRPPPANRLSEEERAEVLAICHDPTYASLPPGQIVPRLADEGRYVASESTFYRVLRAADEQHHRGRSRRPRTATAPPRQVATASNQVWSWDISWLAGPVKGLFFFLYLIVDLYSRKIVGWEIYDSESATHAAEVIQRAVLTERCLGQPLVLHADNGSPMKGATLLQTLYRLGVVPSYSRPHTSNDNPYSEALFRTCKYSPAYPADGFANLEDARCWMADFVHDYNHDHYHSGIRFVTPHQRHEGQDHLLLAQRQAVYEQARARHPERWSGKIRNWEPIAEVWLNPEPAAVKLPAENAQSP